VSEYRATAQDLATYPELDEIVTWARGSKSAAA
jgi:hypothetical protein